MGAPQLIVPGTASGTAPVGGSGNPNTIPRWTGPSTLGDSIITQSGNNIGVGEPSPVGRLQVQGLSNNNTITAIGSTTTGQSYGIFVQAGTNASDRSFGVYNTSLSPYLFVRGDGNVGIGTASPVTTLHVARNGTTDPAIIGSGTNSAVGNFESSDFGRANRWTFGRDNSLTGNFVLAYNGSPRMNTTSSGNVGIGTASPGARTHIKAANTPFRGQLTVEGDGTLAQITLYNGGTTSTDLVGQLYTDSAGSPNFHISAWKNTGALYFETGTSNTLRWQINPSGHFLAGADNSYDIGASGATRPRTVYVGTSIGIGANPTANRALTTVADLDVFGVRVGRGGNASIATNTAVGPNALNSGSAGNRCTAVGNNALLSATGNDSTAVGDGAGYSVTSAARVTAIGGGSVAFVTGSDNTAVGANALFGNSGAPGNGSANTAIGSTALNALTSGVQNVAVGSEALKAITSNGYATAVGARALVAATSGVNVAVGYEAGSNVTTGSSNIILGVQATTAAAADSNQCVIGSATYWVGTNGGATTYYATAGALLGYMQIRLNGANVKIPVYAP